MKGWLISIFVFAVLVVAICCFVYFFAIPKMAAALIPERWQQVTLGKQRSAYEKFLGNTLLKNSDSVKEETWVAHKGNYSYSLVIAFDKDSIAILKSIQYHFKNWLFTRDEKIITDSLQPAIY